MIVNKAGIASVALLRLYKRVEFRGGMTQAERGVRMQYRNTEMRS